MPVERTNLDCTIICILHLYSTLLVFYEVCRILGCPLDRETLNIALQLLDNGANPEALAAVITELQTEARRIK